MQSMEAQNLRSHHIYVDLIGHAAVGASFQTSNTFDTSSKASFGRHLAIVNEGPVESFGSGEHDGVHDVIRGDVMTPWVIFREEFNGSIG